MKNTYVSGRDNLALTIMVPYRCQNNCSFCESKTAYDLYRSNFSRVINTISQLYKENNTLSIPDVVITGGEPMQDIYLLQQIISVIPNDKNVYINTTLTNKNFESFATLVNETSCIKGISVSRHFDSYEEDTKILNDIVKDHMMILLDKPVRINCVLTDNTNIHNIVERWNKYKNVYVSFRENFNTLDMKDLHNPYSNVLMYLANNYKYINHTQCNVCDSTIFEDQIGFRIQYHRGIKNTSLSLGDNKYEINDLVLRQDGELFSDWEFSSENKILPEVLNNTRVQDMRDIFDYHYRPTIENTCYHTCGGSFRHCGGSSC